MRETFEDLAAFGYHIYKDIWPAAVGEVLVREPHNSQYRCPVVVKTVGVVVVHLPRKISRVCSLFLRRGGAIECTVTGGRRYSSDLRQGGLNVPCSLLFPKRSRS